MEHAAHVPRQVEAVVTGVHCLKALPPAAGAVHKNALAILSVGSKHVRGTAHVVPHQPRHVGRQRPPRVDGDVAEVGIAAVLLDLVVKDDNSVVVGVRPL